MALLSPHQRLKRKNNPAVLSEILHVVNRLKSERKEPTFNTILAELSAEGVLEFHKTLRKYLDLLVSAKLLSVKHEQTVQPNIRKKQVYHSKNRKPVVEAGEKALLLYGLNWDVPFPLSVIAETDLQGLARATVSENTVYASLEDGIVESLKAAAKSRKRASEVIVFATALLATEKNIDFEYLIRRAKERRVSDQVASLLLQIDKTLASADPEIEDMATLYELRKRYYSTRKHLVRAVRGIKTTILPMVTPNQVVEYAGKQLGIKG